MDRLDCAIVVAHTTLNKGSVGNFSDGKEGYNEFDFNMELGLQMLSGGDCDFSRNLFVRDPFGNYVQQSARLLKQLQAFNPRCVVELHFNWLMPKVFSQEHWLWNSCRAMTRPGDEDAIELGNNLVSIVADCLELPNTRVQPQVKSWSKARKNPDGNWTPDGPPMDILGRAFCPTVLLEHHVGNNPSAHTRAIARLKDDSLMLAVEKGINQFLNTHP